MDKLESFKKYYAPICSICDGESSCQECMLEWEKEYGEFKPGETEPLTGTEQCGILISDLEMDNRPFDGQQIEKKTSLV